MRANWNLSFGPLDLKLPLDPDPCPGFDWEGAYTAGHLAEHQDSQDRLNADRTWGTGNPSEVGGSGIAFGYSQPDLDAVRVACKALANVPDAQKPDVEHLLRDLLYPMAGFEMTHEVYFARRVQKCAERAMAWFPLEGPVVLDDPGWFPTNLANLHAWTVAHPGQGIPHLNLRAFGNALYAKAAEHKCARVLGAPAAVMWMDTALDILQWAAMPTGQLVTGPDDAHPLDQPSEYTFHWAFAALGAMACAKRLHLPAPPWISTHLSWLNSMPPMTYDGRPTLPGFTYTSGNTLHVSTGPGQQPDPNFGWWSSVCVAAYGMTGDRNLLDWAGEYGPLDASTEGARKLSMLYRGLMENPQ